MKKFRFLLLVAVLIFSLFSPSVYSVQAATSFKDVPNNHSVKKEISYLASLGIVKGYNDGTFKPNNSVTNAQAAIMLVRALKLNTNGRPNPNFTDVPSNHPAFKEIAAAVDAGIFPKSKAFYPNSPITREAMARALVNGFKLQGSSNVYFYDVSSSYWAYSYIMKLAVNHVTTGYGDGTFKPKNTLTRAHFSAFVARALNDSFKPRPENRSITGGLKLDPNKTYVYNVYDQGHFYDEETWYYTGTDYGWDDWTVIREYDETGYFSYFEDQKGMAVGWQDSEIFFDVPYPLAFNSKWSFGSYEWNGYVSHYVVTNMNKTITTPAGTFHHVIEIKDYDGYYKYYAQGVGLVLAVDATVQPAEKTYELIEMY